jgi:hypothetical protein
VPLGRLRIIWKNNNKRDVWEADSEDAEICQENGTIHSGYFLHLFITYLFIYSFIYLCVVYLMRPSVAHASSSNDRMSNE